MKINVRKRMFCDSEYAEDSRHEKRNSCVAKECTPLRPEHKHNLLGRTVKAAITVEEYQRMIVVFLFFFCV